MIAVFACCAVQLIRIRLAAQGFNMCWRSIRESLRTSVRTGTRLTFTDGATVVNHHDTRPGRPCR